MLKEELELYSSIFNYSVISYAIYDENFMLYKVNNTFTILFDKKKDEILGTSILNFLFSNDLKGFKDTIRILLKNKDKRNIEYIARSSDGKYYLKIISNIMRLDGEEYIFSAIIDVTEEQMLLKKLEYLSFHDSLTNLYNRRFFTEELKRLDVKRNLPLTVVMADVNNLKFINDKFGHTVGDELLYIVGNTIKKGCRMDDIVARIGGDEFVILLPKTDSKVAETIVDRIRNLLKAERILSYNVSVSFGCCTKYDINEDIHAIFKKSEDYMYREKSTIKANER